VLLSLFCHTLISVVGTSIVITMGLNVISPHVAFIIQRGLSLLRRGKHGFNTLVTQKQADDVGLRVNCRYMCSSILHRFARALHFSLSSPSTAVGV
jgi:hypothetical protein